MKQRFRILGRHKWVVGATITESVPRGCPSSTRRFTATIRGYRNWKVYQGPPTKAALDFIITCVTEIRDRIDEGDELVFVRPNEYSTEAV